MYYSSYTGKYASHSLAGNRMYRKQVTPLSISMQHSELFLDIPSIINQFNKQAGISTNEASEKFRYLSPAMSVAPMVSP